MKKILSITALLCLLFNCTGCGISYDLFVENHTWTFVHATEKRTGIILECNPDLADRYPEAKPLKTELLPYPDTPMLYVLITGDWDTNRNEWTFALTDTSRTENTYTVTDTGDGDGNDTIRTYTAVVTTGEVDGEMMYTLTVTVMAMMPNGEQQIADVLFTAPMEG